jgi:Amt family ammonium transporter
MSDAAPSAPEFKAGDIAWTLTSTALVWLMIPGLGYFYSGMARSKNALSLIMLSVISIAVVSFQVRKKNFQLHCRGIGLG